jgi:hypothetical protein
MRTKMKKLLTQYYAPVTLRSRLCNTVSILNVLLVCMHLVKRNRMLYKKVDPITLITEPVARHHQVISRGPRKIVSKLLNPELGIIRRSCFGDLRSHFLHSVSRIKIHSTP